MSVAPNPVAVKAQEQTSEGRSHGNFTAPVSGKASKKIWIDLDNSPHVPFFVPIIEEIQRKGHRVFLTARDSYQVRDLLALHKISCRVIGGHWGKHRMLKVIGTCARSVELLPLVLKERPDLAVSHGSRAQLLTSFALGIPSILILDYEFIATTGFIRPKWVFMPEVIPGQHGAGSKTRVAKYPGLKEDVYVPQLKHDPLLRASLGVGEDELMVVVRPPATEAHYHNPDSEALFEAAMKFLLDDPRVRVVLLPRNGKQAEAVKAAWKAGLDARRIVIPERAVDGLSLIWASDLVISGGGTMNREAAALGVPVYSIFRGRIGAVDRYLSDSRRLILLEGAAEVPQKIALEKRARGDVHGPSRSAACDFISGQIVSIAEKRETA